MPIPQYMPAPVASQAPVRSPTPQAMIDYSSLRPQGQPTPYPTPYLPQQQFQQYPKQPFIMGDLNAFPSFEQWLAQRGLQSGAYSQSGQAAVQPQQDPFAPIKDAAQKKATGWLEDQGKDWLSGFGSSGAGAIPEATTGAADVLSGMASPTMPSVGPTLANANLPMLEAPGMFDFSGIGGAGNAILPAAGAVGMYDLFANKRRGGRGALQGAASGAAMGSYFGPWGAGIGAALGAGSSLLNKKSTKEYEADKTERLMGKSSDPGWQQAVQHFRNVEHAPGDTGKNFNANEALARAKQDGKVLWGTSAVLDEFGPEWFSGYSENQREQITRQLANEGLFGNEKGDWNIKNSARAKQIGEEVRSGKPSGGIQNLPGLVKGPAAINLPANIQEKPLMISRSKTSSPGIDKNGRRITYGGK